VRSGRAWFALALIATCVSVACSTIDFASVPREPSTAWNAPASTRLGRMLFADARARDGQSAFRLLDGALEAFAARLALIEAAERTLDLQYYIMRGETSQVVADRLLAAADRGVRVRLLLDDTATFGRERGLAALDGHRNIEVRSFNPFRLRGPRYVVQGIELAFRGAQLNRRMHNKAFIADAAYAIVGGRNLGDEYFASGGTIDFHDVDVLAGGPVAREAAASFDRYWNSEHAVPISALVPRATEEERAGARTVLADIRARYMATAQGRALQSSALTKAIAAAQPPPVWAPAKLVADEPHKVEGGGASARGADPPIAASLEAMIRSARRDIVVVSAYLIPGDEGMAVLKAARERGVSVRVLTNSLATTDVELVHAAGYARYRVPLVASGVELYELRPQAAAPAGEGSGPSSGSRASLHAKALIVDARDVIVGSFNVDPRSLELNTEIGVVLRSPELARTLLERVEQAMQPRNSFRVVLADDGQSLRWLAHADGRPATWTDEPETTELQRIRARALAWLPIERQL
jgi:putative cardiolipin synthase